MLQIMFLQSLLTCLVLSTFSAQAKVVDSFDECSTFFYQGKPPQGIDQNAVKICQKLRNTYPIYATLYSVYHRIPLYSAYIFKSDCSGPTPTSWHLEPQLYDRNRHDHMVLERDCTAELNNLQETQALSRDYEHTGYDRGHLYPNSFQCGDNRNATFTLTNAAPMDACFNRIQWKIWEGNLKTFLKKQKISESVYIVTGTVPDEKKIPERLKRITVPSHIWTAVCYKPPLAQKYISFGYIGINQPELDIKLMSITEMNVQLDKLYKNPNPSVKIFHDDCFSDEQSSFDAQNNFFMETKLPEYKTKMSESDKNKLLAGLNDISSGGKITKLTVTLAFNSSSAYFITTEKLKKKTRNTCVLSEIPPKQKRFNRRKRYVFESSESFKCQLVPEKSVEKMTAADGSPCISSQYDGYRCTCVTAKNKNQPCCSTPCLYQDKLNDYQCYSGSTQIKCSPQYSLITINGKRCRDDHPCAMYGEDYYWCYTDSSWEYCSPPLWQSRAKNGKYCRSNNACAKYKKGEPWCYTDENDKPVSCCTSDDCYSAVNYKTCKPDHKCGYHGEKYLWCYTTDGKWDYCCKQCP